METFKKLDVKNSGRINWPKTWQHLKTMMPPGIEEGTQEYYDEEY